MKCLTNSVFSFILINFLVILLIDLIVSKRVLNRQKRTEDSPQEDSEVLSSEEIPCSKQFFKQWKDVPKKSLCRPRKRLVALKMESKYYTPGLHLSPMSYEVERCDGDNFCHMGTNQKCLPTEKEIIEIPVHSIDSLGVFMLGGERRQSNKKCMLVKIEKHTACKCMCAMSQQNCNPRQDFDAHRCSCECKDKHMPETCSSHNRMWSKTKCQCVCSPSISRDCSSGATFDEENCRCVQSKR